MIDIATKQLIDKYNNDLERYYEGCEYIKTHYNGDKYYPLLLDILDDINIELELIQKEMNPTTDEILNGINISEV